MVLNVRFTVEKESNCPTAVLLSRKAKHPKHLDDAIDFA
jgi:hypothetical protein